MIAARTIITLLMSPAALAIAQQKEGFPPDNPDSWRLAGTAKVFCSAIFVSHRDSAEVRPNLAPYFLGPKLDSLSAIHIDRTRKLVRLTLANGCVQRVRRGTHAASRRPDAIARIALLKPGSSGWQAPRPALHAALRARCDRPAATASLT